jgi:hypothetical protein
MISRNEEKKQLVAYYLHSGPGTAPWCRFKNMQRAVYARGVSLDVHPKNHKMVNNVWLGAYPANWTWYQTFMVCMHSFLLVKPPGSVQLRKHQDSAQPVRAKTHFPILAFSAGTWWELIVSSWQREEMAWCIQIVGFSGGFTNRIRDPMGMSPILEWHIGISPPKIHWFSLWSSNVASREIH